jgi:hypothetical protein
MWQEALDALHAQCEQTVAAHMTLPVQTRTTYPLRSAGSISVKEGAASAGGSGDASGDIVAFSCGHAYSRRDYADILIPAFADRLSALFTASGVPLPASVRLFEADQRHPSCSSACARCVAQSVASELSRAMAEKRRAAQRITMLQFASDPSAGDGSGALETEDVDSNDLVDSDSNEDVVGASTMLTRGESAAGLASGDSSRPSSPGPAAASGNAVNIPIHRPQSPGLSHSPRHSSASLSQLQRTAPPLSSW